MKREKKRILILLVTILSGFVIQILYMSYFQIFMAEGIKENAYNKRLWLNEEKVVRGSIYDSEGRLLAYSENIDGVTERKYMYDRLYSHIIGYSSREYGKSGIEKSWNSYLIGANEKSPVSELIELINPGGVGNNIYLTINTNLQAQAYEALSGKKGSIIIMSPKTGEILAMVSLPDFNVNNLSKDWQSISEDSGSPLFNRATQGLYPPGSVFKIVTATALLRDSKETDTFICEGKIVFDGKEFRDYDGKSHGKLDLTEAFAVSCNTYFTMKAVELGQAKLLPVAKEYYFNRKFDFDLETSRSEFPETNLSTTELAAAGIGQGKVLATPLNIAMMVSAIANDGKMIKPVIVKEVTSPENKKIYNYKETELDIIGDSEENTMLKDMMRDVVKSGTGVNAGISGIAVAGKTGTAENQSGKNHAWFAGFAPADDPKVTVVVILEEEGSTGGAAAAPIAGKMIRYAFDVLGTP